MGGMIKTITVLAQIQENGIIRAFETGQLIGRTSDDVEFEQLEPFDVFTKSNAKNGAEE